jgi:hypothetical protein
MRPTDTQTATHARRSDSHGTYDSVSVDPYAYKSSLERTARELSLGAEPVLVKPEEGGQTATFEARLALDDESYVDVHEVVVLRRGARRRKYGYSIVARGRFQKSYDLDPSHERSAHMHRGETRLREPAPIVTLRRVAEEAWELHSQAAEVAGVRAVASGSRAMP